MRKVYTIMALATLALAGIVSIGQAGNGGGQAPGPISNGLNVPSNQQVMYHSEPGQCQDCWASGITLREAGNPASGLAGGTIAVPPQVAQNAVWARIFWVTLGDPPPILGVPSINGNAVAPLPLGPVTASPCWAPSLAFAYSADVLPFLQVGVNSLTGFADSGNRNVSPSMEGVSLVIVYASRVVDKEIVVLGGNDALNTTTGPIQVDLSIPAFSPPGFGAELTMIVADGQPLDGWNDDFLWNGTVVSSPNAFQGLDPGPGVGMWDTQEYGVATGGGNTASLSTVPYPFGYDCLNWVGTVFCVKRGGCIVPVEPSTWSHIKGLISH